VLVEGNYTNVSPHCEFVIKLPNLYDISFIAATVAEMTTRTTLKYASKSLVIE
jgi:hypothetical protein